MIMKTLRELTNKIGMRAIFSRDAMHFEVRVVDVKFAFGRVDYLIKPVAGDGAAWVSETSLKFTHDKE
jgi:response regulator of citrate/malate metabolism